MPVSVAYESAGSAITHVCPAIPIIPNAISMHPIIYSRRTFHTANVGDSIAQRPVIHNPVIRVPRGEGLLLIYDIPFREGIIRAAEPSILILHVALHGAEEHHWGGYF